MKNLTTSLEFSHFPVMLSEIIEKARKNVLYRMNKGYVPKKSTLVKYNLSWDELDT